MYDWNYLAIILCDERTQTCFAEKAFWKPPIGVLQPFAVEYLGLNLGGCIPGVRGVWSYGSPTRVPDPPRPPQTENVYTQSTHTYRASRTLAGLVYVFSYIISGDK